MPRGGRREGAGPKPTLAPWLNKDGLSPLETLLEIMRSVDAPLTTRLAAAKEAAPYCHRKLAPETAAEAKDTAPTMTAAEMDWSRDLDVRPAAPN